MRNTLAVFTLLLSLLSVCPEAWADYEITTLKDVMVPMRDGVRLATDIYLPAVDGRPAAGRFPVIMERTPYNKAIGSKIPGSAAMAKRFVPRGYVLVVQDIRGRYHSEGHWSLLRDDPNDGFDTAQWIGAQPWSNQKIGTYGVSYGGGTQHAMALAGAPYLKVMIPREAVSEVGLYGVRHHGAFELRWLNWIFTMGNATDTPDDRAAAARAAGDPETAGQLVQLGKSVQDYVGKLPLRPGETPLKFAPDYESVLVEIMGHGANDSYWRDHGISIVDHADTYADVPECHVGGWYDSWGTQVINLNFPILSRTKKSRQQLIVGPWVHASEHLNYAGEAQFTADASMDITDLQGRWFDHYLMDADNGLAAEKPVRIYVMGGGDAHKTPEGRVFVGGHWREENEWPLARTVYRDFFLHSGGTLSTHAPTAERPRPYVFDPKNPVPTLGGNVSSFGKLGVPGAMDQRGHPGFWLTSDTKPLSDRSDVLVFQTPPLDSDMEVTGRLVVKLWAASSARDTDFTVKLVDVYPPNGDYPEGVALNIADGIVRARYRNNLDHEEFLKPGKPYEFTIEMYPTSLLFKRGHRVRLDVSSSNFPRFDVNPNTAEPLNDNRRWQTATNTIFVDRAHPSKLILPVIPP